MLKEMLQNLKKRLSILQDGPTEEDRNSRGFKCTGYNEEYVSGREYELEAIIEYVEKCIDMMKQSGKAPRGIQE